MQFPSHHAKGAGKSYGGSRYTAPGQPSWNGGGNPWQNEIRQNMGKGVGKGKGLQHNHYHQHAHSHQGHGMPSMHKKVVRNTPGKTTLQRSVDGPIAARPSIGLVPQFELCDSRLSKALPTHVSPIVPPPAVEDYPHLAGIPECSTESLPTQCRTGYMVTTTLNAAVGAGAILGCSDSMLEIMNLTKDDVLGSPLFGLVAGEWSTIVNGGECGKFVIRDPFKPIDQRFGKVKFNGLKRAHNFSYRQDPFILGPFDLIFWQFGHIDSSSADDTCERRLMYDNNVIAEFPVFVKYDGIGEVCGPYNPAEVAPEDDRAVLSMNAWGALQVLMFLRQNFITTFVGHFQSHAAGGLDLITVCQDMDKFFRQCLAEVILELGMRPPQPAEAILPCNTREQKMLRNSVENTIGQFLSAQPIFYAAVHVSFNPWSEQFLKLLSSARQVGDQFLDQIPKYLGENLYLTDSLPRHANRLQSQINKLLDSYGTRAEPFVVLRSRNFKMLHVFGDYTRQVGEAFGCVIQDSFIVFRPRQYERVRMLFQIASLWLDNETLEHNGVPTANNRVPRIGLCTNMTLVEAFKDQSSIVFGGADRLDRRVSQLSDEVLPQSFPRKAAATKGSTPGYKDAVRGSIPDASNPFSLSSATQAAGVNGQHSLPGGQARPDPMRRHQKDTPFTLEEQLRLAELQSVRNPL